MGNLNPHLRDVGDFKHKLWDHLALIASFELDIDSPYPVPEPAKFVEKPKQVPYKQGDIKKRIPYYSDCQSDEKIIYHLEQRTGS